MVAPAFSGTATHQAAGFKSGAQTIAVPSSGSNASGDLMLIFIYSEATGDTPTVAGFTMQTKLQATDHTWQVGHKRLTAGDTGNYTITYDGSGAWREAVCVKITGAVASGNPYDVTPVGAFTNTATNTSPGVNVTTVTNDVLLVMAACSVNGGAWTPPGSTPTFTERYDSSSGVTVATAVMTTAGAVGSRSFTVGGSAARMSTWSFPVKPAATNSTINGTIATTFSFTSAVVGTRTNNGATLATTFAFTSAVVGKPIVAGAVATTFSFTSAVVGKVKVAGAIATNFGFTSVVAGAPEAPSIHGSIATDFAFTSAVAGKRTARGATVATTFAFTSAVAGAITVAGAVATTFSFTSTVAGKRVARGAAIATNFGFTATAVGDVATFTPGEIATTFAFTSSVVGKRRARGATIVTNFGFTTSLRSWSLAFPGQSIRYRLEVAPGADLSAHPDTYAWTELTPDLYMGAPVDLKVGSEDEQSETQFSLTFTLRNSSSLCPAALGMEGRYTSDNLSSDLWPYFDHGAPFRFSIDTGGTWDVQGVGWFTSATPTWPANSSRLALVAVEAYGLLVQKQVGEVVASAMTRSIGPSHPVQWLPMEDADSAGRLISGVAGGNIGSIEGGASIGVTGGPFGTSGSVDLTDGGMITLLTGEPTGRVVEENEGWEVEITATGPATLPAHGTEYAICLMAIQVPGNTAGWPIWGIGARYNTLAEKWQWCQFEIKEDGSSTGSNQDVRPGYDMKPGETVHWRIVARRYPPGTEPLVGADMSIRAYRDGTDDAELGFFYFSGEVMTYPKSIIVNRTLSNLVIINGMNPAYVSQLAYWNTADRLVPRAFPDTAGAATGHYGEMATTRAARLCDEDGVPHDIDPDEDSPLMGPQLPGAFVPLLRECEVTANAILDDHLGYVQLRTLASMINQTTQMIIDGSDRQMYTLEPTRDNQKIANDVTAVRTWDNATARVQDEEHQALRGRWTRGVSPNVPEPMGLLFDQAGWAVHVGTAEGYRVPQITIRPDLKPADIIPTWRTTRLGDLITLINPPRQFSQDEMLQILRGYQQTFIKRRGPWVVTMNLAPYRQTASLLSADSGPFGAYEGWLDWDSAVLTIAANQASTTMSVTASPRLSTASGDMGYRIVVDGIVWTVTAVSSATPQVLSVTRDPDQPARIHVIGSRLALHDDDVIILGL